MSPFICVYIKNVIQLWIKSLEGEVEGVPNTASYKNIFVSNILFLSIIIFIFFFYFKIYFENLKNDIPIFYSLE